MTKDNTSSPCIDCLENAHYVCRGTNQCPCKICGITFKKSIVVCSEDCACHKGARYDQIECKCDWFCGDDATPELLIELKHEKYTLEVLSN